MNIYISVCLCRYHKWLQHQVSSDPQIEINKYKLTAEERCATTTLLNLNGNSAVETSTNSNNNAIGSNITGELTKESLLHRVNMMENSVLLVSIPPSIYV